MSRISFAERLNRLASPFFMGDKVAGDQVTAMMLPGLVSRALASGLPQEQAYDCAVDAIVYVKSRDRKELEPGSSLAALMNTALDWGVSRAKREWARKGGPNPEYSVGIGEVDEQEDAASEPLVDMEVYLCATGGLSHEYLTSITWASPEDELVAENLREWLEKVAVSACGRDKWDVYYKVVVLDQTQTDVAAELGLSQQRVSQIVDEVGHAIKAAMTGG